jgi:dihydrofolate synthase/folylpolyglutamate synthase
MREGRPGLLFDGAHNAAGARALRDYLDEFVRRPITIIFGAMRDKALTEMATTLFPAADSLILTQPDNPRAATTETLARHLPPHFASRKITLAPSPREALRVARAQTPPDGIICVTGSLYLIGEVKKAAGEGQ